MSLRELGEVAGVGFGAFQALLKAMRASCPAGAMPLDLRSHVLLRARATQASRAA
jgi:hypothetical protein